MSEKPPKLRQRSMLLLCGFVFLLAGLAAYFSAVLIRGLLESLGISNGLKIAPITEEALKAAGAGIIALTLMKRVKLSTFWMLVAGALLVGLTFGFAETLLDPGYRLHFSERIFTSIPAHGLMTITVAIGMYFPFAKYPKRWAMALPVLFYFGAVLWHAWWNSSIFPEPLRYIALPIVSVLVILIPLKISQD